MLNAITEQTRALLRIPSTENLPQRVLANIREDQKASEILVSWIQVTIVSLFAVLYVLAPKPPNEQATIEAAPWAIGFYVLFSIMRLVLACCGIRRTWFPPFSAIVDVLLLLALIWSFHIQYGQPAAFVLKSPTLLYVFIFIALRALLFEPRLVMLTGVTAAFGWLVMVLLVVWLDGGMQVTRNYVDYMTSSSVLIGAEFDKIVSILVVTGLITLAMLRARALLIRAVADGTRAHDLARFFAPEVAEQITASESEIVPGRGEERQAAILYVDIRGFSEMAETMTPDTLISLLSDYQARLIPAITAHHGTAEKYLGDGMMASFGAALKTETYAADAMRAVDGILANIAHWNAARRAQGQATLRLGVAVTAGPVVFGAVGGEARLELAVVGHPVNLAAKLEKHTKQEGVQALCTVEAYELALRQGYHPVRETERRDSRAVDGITDSIDLILLFE